MSSHLLGARVTARMAKLDRILRLAHLLAETVEGLTLDEIALEISVDRRTAERMRDVIRIHFALEEVQDDRSKRFRIHAGLRRIYTRPSDRQRGVKGKSV